MRSSKEAPSAENRTLSLATLVEEMAREVVRANENFARLLAKALHTRAAHITFSDIEAMGLDEVVVTFNMDESMHLVVTGELPPSQGQVTIKWREEDFVNIPVRVHESPKDSPYLFATLDFSLRGQMATLLKDNGGFRKGERVRIRALATLGGDATYRVAAGQAQGSIEVSALNVDEA